MDFGHSIALSNTIYSVDEMKLNNRNKRTLGLKKHAKSKPYVLIIINTTIYEKVYEMVFRIKNWL
jgi:hypothetical protein